MEKNRLVEPSVLDSSSLLAVLDEMVTEGQLLAQVYRSLEAGVRWAERQHKPVIQQRFTEWFRHACCKGDGSEYSPDWRAVIVRQFNEVGRRWLEAGLVGERLVVTNYRRSKQNGTVDEEINLSVLPSHIQRLRCTFLRCLLHPGEESHPDQGAFVAFCRFAFAAIALGGVCWRQAFATLASLRWKHIRTTADGYMLIPRAGGVQRLYVPSVVALCALALGEHLREHRRSSPDPETPILPTVMDDQGSSVKADGRRDDILRVARARFNTWLCDLCHQADIPAINVQSLAIASQKWLECYAGNEVAAAVQGIALYNPVVEGQCDIFASYREEFRLPGEILQWAGKAESPREPTVSAQAAHRTATRLRGPDALEELLRRLTSACREATLAERGSRQEMSLLRHLAAQLLCSLIPDIEGEEMEVTVATAYKHWFTGSEDSSVLPESGGIGIEDARDRFDVACLALWLDSLLGNKAPTTVSGYCSEGLNIKRLFPDKMLLELDQDDGLEMIGSVHEWEDGEASQDRERASATRKHLRAAWKNLHTFLGERLGLPVEEINWGSLAVESRNHPVHLLSQCQFARLLGVLCCAWQDAGAQGNTQEATRYRSGFFAALLAYFFGLRLGEVCRLRIEDMILRSLSPHLHIWRSKGGKSRQVYTHHVPDTALALALLRAERDRRWLEEGQRFDAYLLSRTQSDNEEAGLDALRRTVSSTVIETMEQLGLRPEGADHGPVFHTLRHCFANRLFVLGVPIPDIARAMGHSAPDTTVGSYLHAFDFLQRERLEALVAHLEQTEPGWQGITIVGLAQLLGIGRTGVIEAIRQFERETDAIIPKHSVGEFAALRDAPGRRDQRLIPYQWAVRVVALRLGLPAIGEVHKPSRNPQL